MDKKNILVINKVFLYNEYQGKLNSNDGGNLKHIDVRALIISNDTYENLVFEISLYKEPKRIIDPAVISKKELPDKEHIDTTKTIVIKGGDSQTLALRTYTENYNQYLIIKNTNGDNLLDSDKYGYRLEYRSRILTIKKKTNNKVEIYSYN